MCYNRNWNHQKLLIRKTFTNSDGQKANFRTSSGKYLLKSRTELNALAWIANYMDVNKKLIIMIFHNSRIVILTMQTIVRLSQCSYCPLACMFHSRKRNRRINKIHKCALRIVHSNHQCTFEELFERYNSFTIDKRNLQKLAIEMFKLNNGLWIIIFDTNQKQSLRLIMSILKKWQVICVIFRTQNMELHNSKKTNLCSIKLVPVIHFL